MQLNVKEAASEAQKHPAIAVVFSVIGALLGGFGTHQYDSAGVRASLERVEARVDHLVGAHAETRAMVATIYEAERRRKRTERAADPGLGADGPEPQNR